jgi:hypothetical protein
MSLPPMATHRRSVLAPDHRCDRAAREYDLIGCIEILPKIGQKSWFLTDL